MRLNTKQFIFSECLGKLIIYIYSKGYCITLGDAWRPDKQGHKKWSWHYIRLAIDLNLFNSKGKYLTATEDHQEFGEYWESLHPLCTWGGRFRDGNHYSLDETSEALKAWRKKY